MFRFLLSSDVLDSLRLDEDPQGWDALVYKLERHPKYHGIAFSVSATLIFHGRAAEYIRTVYEAAGAEGVVRLTVFERDENNLRFDEVYSGLLALDEYKATAQGVEVPLDEAGFTKKFLSLDDVQIDLLRTTSQGGSLLTTTRPLRLEMHSQPIVKRTEFGPTKFQAESMTPNVSTAAQRVSVLVFGLGQPTINELETFTYETGTFEDDNPPALFTATGNGPYTVDINLDTSFKILASVGRFARGDIEYYFQVADGAPRSLVRDLVADNEGDYDSRGRLNASASFTVDMNIGDNAYLWGRIIVDEVTGNILGNYSFEYRARVNTGSYLRIAAVTSTEDTEATGMLAHETLQRCVESITDQPGAFYSEYFGRPDCLRPYAQDGPGALTFVTSSWLLRNFPLAEKPLFASFKDAYESLDSQHCLGAGIDLRDGRQVVRVEQRSHFYQTTVGLRLTAAINQQKSAARARIFNQATIGYSRWKSGNENGLKEFNGKRTYVLPISRVKGTYTAVSSYIAAGYVIEETRRDQYVATPGKENSGDGQNFLICLRRTDEGFETERDQDFISVEGVLVPALTYNLRVSPGRMLRAHGAWLRAGLHHQEARRITQGPPEGNEKISTQLLNESAPLDEAAEVLVSELPAPFFFAEEYQLDTTLSIPQLKRLKANPYKLIAFPDAKGATLSGWLLSADIKPASRECTLTLLRYS